MKKEKWWKYAVATLIALVLGVGVSVFAGHWMRDMMNVTMETRVVTDYLKRHKEFRPTVDYERKIRYALKFADMFEIEPRLLYAIGIRETEYADNIISTNKDNHTGKNIDIGDYQINLRCWEYELGNIATLAEMIKDKRNLKTVVDYLLESEINTFMACYVLKIKIYHAGNNFNGLRGYNGAGEVAERYAKSVIDIYVELNDIAKHNEKTIF